MAAQIPGNVKTSRRHFLKIGCLATTAVGLSVCGVAALSPTPDPPPVELSAFTFGKRRASSRVLLAYASFAGSTMEVAAEIGKTLAGRGFTVEVVPVLEDPPVDDYDFVLIGSAVHGSEWLPEAIEFVEAHQAALNRVPVALFSVCLAGLSEDEATLSERLVIFDTVRGFVKPVAEKLFAGKVDRHGVSLFLPGWLARFFPTLDFRKWDIIRTWAENLEIPENEERQ